ncbi:MAG: amidohydrolase family protein [Pseudomonadota bacterium]
MPKSLHVVRRVLVPLTAALLLGGCITSNKAPELNRAATEEALETEPWRRLPKPDHTLENFIPGKAPDYCFDRQTQPYTSVVDAHYHPRPFGGPPLDFETQFKVLEAGGVRFVNFFGIGQVLELDSNCTYYLDCPGVTAMPSIKNDFANALDIANLDPDKVHITLSMTFMDLAHPEHIVALIELYDREFPGMFSWTGELNLIKQALLGNNHEPATFESIDAWAPFMAILRERGIPVTLHADLGNDRNPIRFEALLHYAAQKYPDNKIVWAHMGLSKELGDMDPVEHVTIVKRALDNYPNLMIDISWDVIFNEYHQWGDIYVPFLNEYSERVLPGTDFVAAGYKDPQQYFKELEVTSRVLAYLDNEAFRNIALGQNYFEYLDLDFEAPRLCPSTPGP